MDCAARGTGTPCTGPATRRCGHCGAVAYCSLSHQISHWNNHKEECSRLEQQMQRADILHDFPFTYSTDATLQVSAKQMTRCSFLATRGLRHIGLWKYECSCHHPIASSEYLRINDDWNLPSALCPCTEPKDPVPINLSDWKDYYQWRCLPLHSPVALLLHWPLTIYQSIQLSATRRSISEISGTLHIHYLGPEKELLQLAVFGELHALLPHLQVHIELIGPAVPQFRDGERINLCNYAHCLDLDCTCKSSSENRSWGVSNSNATKVTLWFRKGYYHDCFRDIVKDSFPDIIVASNAGIAAYSDWLPTIELIREIDVPAIFSDFCEEAAHLAARCISAVSGRPLTVPIQVNPFRQPMAVEDTVLDLPCYSNCFLFGM
ncbi:hypothetical protein MRB53_012055 [Persea americana]|uniref:Uncharacterized protein n=1 Tax=Persea americana TaxID=3435 RepID=A0ACC2LX54_PERAE|nr:hypothetical protein MRB53_012055 [Persea americana]|eukprot:TRINITY_DN10923_c0_g1_i2.p1 TRINITY_DN10923_c0_g1~~TRINITY_DN10923_c0_g1_i2.p1  ORF type:complete len:377 (+),score=44.30 TRINITY_DN10923_c0_g1_i2:86-1216(+)